MNIANHRVFLAVLSLSSIAILTETINAQQAQFVFDTPQGWRAERFKLPASFAPQMKFSGVEELRFAPGMFKRDSDNFMSYLFVFEVQDPSAIEQARLQTELKAYYQGLSSRLLKKKPGEPTSDASVRLDLVEQDGAIPTQWNDVKSYRGTVDWIEPFVTKQRHKLFLTVDQFSLEGYRGQFIFVCASPADRNAAIWNTLHRVRETFSVEKAK